MDAYLWPLLSPRFYTKVIWRRKKDFGEIEKNRKINAYVRVVYNSLCVRVCTCVRLCECVDYICVLFCMVVYVIISMCVYDDTCTALHI